MTREEAIEWLKCINTKKFGWDEYAMQESQMEIRERCEQHVREALDMAIKALQAESTHCRLIDADALMEYCSNQKTKTITNNDIARFPTVSTDRPHGEWIDKGDYALCSECGGSSGTQYDGVERIPRITTFCPHCGVKMKVGNDE